MWLVRRKTRAALDWLTGRSGVLRISLKPRMMPMTRLSTGEASIGELAILVRGSTIGMSRKGRARAEEGG